QPSAGASGADEQALRSTLETRLAYVITGDAEVDRTSKAGLQGLTLFLAQRTALEAGEPVGLDPARDELAFYPLIYWPIVPSAPKPSREALEHIDAYMKQGGTVLFDTRDAVEAPSGPGAESRGPGMQALRAILSSLDIPELEPVRRDHVLTKTFYLLKDFPGRFSSGQLWVEALPSTNDDEPASRPARAGDGVSSIIITSNDFAGAWAMRQDGQAMLPLVSAEPRQREFAFRAGVNIVMYTLTGNYKADQVHVPAWFAPLRWRCSCWRSPILRLPARIAIRSPRSPPSSSTRARARSSAIACSRPMRCARRSPNGSAASPAWRCASSRRGKRTG